MRLLHTTPTPLDHLLPNRHFISRTSGQWSVSKYGKALELVEVEPASLLLVTGSWVVPTLIFDTAQDVEDFLAECPQDWGFLVPYIKTLRSITGQLFVLEREELKDYLMDWGFNEAGIAEIAKVGYSQGYVTSGQILPHAPSRRSPLTAQFASARIVAIWNSILTYRIAEWAQTIAKAHNMQAELAGAEVQRFECEVWGSTVVVPEGIDLPGGEGQLMIQFYKRNGKPLCRPVPLAPTMTSVRWRMTTHRVRGNGSYKMKASLFDAKLENMKNPHPGLLASTVKHNTVPVDVVVGN